jgi:CHAT domain-containing protein
MGTLWKVEDQAAASLMKSFHESYRRLDVAPEALREAQLRTIEASESPVRHLKSWAAFQVYGAAASPQSR